MASLSSALESEASEVKPAIWAASEAIRASLDSSLVSRDLMKDEMFETEASEPASVRRNSKRLSEPALAASLVFNRPTSETRDAIRSW